MSSPFLTTVIPAYNEGERLPAFLAAWAAEGARHRSVTAIARVVDDGSQPAHQERHRQGVADANAALVAAGASHRVEYVLAPVNGGKGAAIRLGWSTAEPASMWLSLIDADGAVPAEEYWRLADRLPDAAFDALCGSRVRMAGRSVTRSRFRHLQSRFFATVVDMAFRLGFNDTQCGVKFFRAERLRPLLPRLREDRWLLDIELLVLLHDSGARLVEEPIDCHERGGSSLVFGLDPAKMILRIFALRSRLRQPENTTA